MTGRDYTIDGKRWMNSLDWIHLYMTFSTFKVQAARHNLYTEELQRIEDDMFTYCPIPQPPQPMKL